MQENTFKGLVPKASKTPFYLSLLFIVLVAVSSVYLFVSNNITRNRITEKEQMISVKDNEIAELKKDRRVIVTNILKSQSIKSSLDLRAIIASFRDAANRANVRLKGFTINNDVITTQLIAKEGIATVHPDPASTIIAMMGAYDNPGGLNGFTLKPIISIDGTQNERITPIQFRIVQNTSK